MVWKIGIILAALAALVILLKRWQNRLPSEESRFRDYYGDLNNRSIYDLN